MRSMATALLVALALAVPVGVLARTVDLPPLQVVPSLDLARYVGVWYEIARFPNRFQRECVSDVVARYERRDDGRLKVVNSCRQADGTVKEAEGVARLADANGPASKLKVRFAPAFLSWLPMVWGDYQVIALSPDYAHSLVGTPDREYLWILSRTPEMDEATYQGLTARAAEQGFDVERLVRTEQRATAR
jgi:apolipoprotein D and lipocalin family protein